MMSTPGRSWRDRIQIPLPTIAFVAALIFVGLSPIFIVTAHLSHESDIFHVHAPLVADLGDPTIADQQHHFAERIEEAFPVGMPVEKLESTLTGQGFSPSPAYDGYEHRRHIERASFPCLMGWNVLWTVRNGIVTAVRGIMTATCL